jgi:hypothetical protein
LCVINFKKFKLLSKMNISQFIYLLAKKLGVFKFYFLQNGHLKLKIAFWTKKFSNKH